MSHGEDHLAQPGDAGGGLEMANVRFGGTEIAGGIAVGLEHRAQHLYFDGIAESGAGAVCFDELNIGARDTGLRLRLPNHGRLRRAVRCGKTMRASVLIHGAAAQQRPDGIAVPLCVAVALEDEHQGAFSAHVSIGGRVERAAAALRRQHTRTGECGGEVGGEHDIHPTNQRQITRPGAEAFASLMHRDE